MSKRIPPYPKRPHKTGQARVRIGGRDYYLGRWDSPESRQQYARLVAELAAGVNHASPRAASEITVAEVGLRWIEAATVERGADSAELAHFRRALGVLTTLYGSSLAAEFGTAQLRAVRQAMLAGSWLPAEERTEREKAGTPIGWCRNVTNRQIVRLRTVWRWAEETAGIVPRGSWGHLCSLRAIARNDRSARQTAPRQAATWEQVAAAIAAVPPAVGIMLELQWWTGMRPSEVVKMRACDVRRDGPDGCWLYRLEQHKNSWREGGGPEDVVLGPECQRVLGPWLDSARTRGPEAWLFPPSWQGQGRHYTAHAYAVAVGRACEEKGIPRFSPYMLRHSAKKRITREAGLDAARAQLRQHSIQTTDGYARERDIELAAKAARKTG